jgi:hypothetical protein
MITAKGWVVRLSCAFVASAAVLAAAGWTPVQASSQPARTLPSAPTTSPSGAYSCAPTESHRAGERVVSTARYGRYQATLSGRVDPGGFVARPLLTLAYDGKTEAVYQPLAPGPLTDFSGIGEVSGPWTQVKEQFPGKGSDLCLANFSRGAGVVALVAVNDPPNANECCEIVNLIQAGPEPYANNAIGAVNLGPEAPAVLVAEAGTALFVTANTAFFEQFAAEVDTAMPVKVLQVGP